MQKEVSMARPGSTTIAGRIVIAAAAALTGAQAYAQWGSKSQAGFVMARGNTETETANAKFEIDYEVEHWKHSFDSSLLYGRSAEVTTGERWDAKWQTDQKISERSFWFGSLRYEDDRYSGFDYQGTASVGAGRDFIDGDETKLSIQLGVGVRRLRPEELVRNEQLEVVDRIAGEIEDDVVGNGTLKFEHAFNESTKVLNTLLVETGSANTLSQNELALQVRMSRLFALSLGLKVRNNSQPPPEQERMDTLTTLNLVFEVKD
jgi:putative salt-induced outer membrane protein